VHLRVLRVLEKFSARAGGGIVCGNAARLLRIKSRPGAPHRGGAGCCGGVTQHTEERNGAAQPRIQAAPPAAFGEALPSARDGAGAKEPSAARM
jgi:hypothetical protein